MKPQPAAPGLAQSCWEKQAGWSALLARRGLCLPSLSLVLSQRRVPSLIGARVQIEAPQGLSIAIPGSGRHA